MLSSQSEVASEKRGAPLSWHAFTVVTTASTDIADITGSIDIIDGVDSIDSININSIDIDIDTDISRKVLK